MLLRVLILSAGITLILGCSSQSPDSSSPQMPAGMRESIADRQAGRSMFMKHCARCHGTAQEHRQQVSARFRSPPPDFTEPTYRHADPAYLFKTIRQGRGGAGMPAWGAHFSAEQTWQLVTYLLSRSAF